jgi:hypothetical protein
MLDHGHLEIIGSGFNPHGDPVPLEYAHETDKISNPGRANLNRELMIIRGEIN